jgi:hypothetical protein
MTSHIAQKGRKQLQWANAVMVYDFTERLGLIKAGIEGFEGID